MNECNLILLGAITSQYLVVSLFFIRFAKKTEDIFFKYFAISFLLLGIERIVLWFLGTANESQPIVYLLRLCAFMLIIGAVLHKNRQARTEIHVENIS